MITDSKVGSKLPEIFDTPQHHPDCCLSLSTALIQHIGQLFPPGSLVHSIGSGSGLLEALLQEEFPQIKVEGVEVNDSVNKYLQADKVTVVNGTWHINSLSSEATAWLFVYPRDPSLITRYFERCRVPEMVIWLGPKVDWQDFRTQFLVSTLGTPQEVQENGLASYETMVVMTRH